MRIIAIKSCSQLLPFFINLAIDLNPSFPSSYSCRLQSYFHRQIVILVNHKESQSFSISRRSRFLLLLQRSRFLLLLQRSRFLLLLQRSRFLASFNGLVSCSSFNGLVSCSSFNGLVSCSSFKSGSRFLLLLQRSRFLLLSRSRQLHLVYLHHVAPKNF